MPNIPSKPSIALQEWVNGSTALDHNNLTHGLNENLANLKTAVDGLIDYEKAIEGNAFDGEVEVSSPSDNVYTLTLPQPGMYIVNLNYLTQQQHSGILLVSKTWSNHGQAFMFIARSPTPFFQSSGNTAFGETDTLTQYLLGTQLYKHTISFTCDGDVCNFVFITKYPTPMDSLPASTNIISLVEGQIANPTYNYFVIKYMGSENIVVNHDNYSISDYGFYEALENFTDTVTRL